MQTFYIRHTRDIQIEPEFWNRLRAENRIAIHFPNVEGETDDDPDTRSLNPSDYRTAGKKALNAFHALSKHGGYVCAEFFQDTERGILSPTCIVGRVEPGTPIELIEGRWWQWDKLAVLKTIRLRQVREIPASRQPVLLSGRPRQGTVMRWHRVGSFVRDLVEGRDTLPTLDRLSPTLQEVLCAEYLRTPEAEDDGLPRIASLTLPVGRTLRDLDLVGLTAGGRAVISQVTHTRVDRVSDKLDRLAACAGPGDVAVLFCRCDQAHERDGVLVYPLSRVFERYTSTPVGQTWLDAVLLRGSFSV